MHHHNANPADLKAIAFGIIASKEPMVRRALEAELVFDYGYHAQKVTTALQGMVESKRIARYTLDRPGIRKPIAYTTGREPTSKELRKLYKLYDQRDRWLPNSLIRDAGERYVRALFTASTRYREVTQKSRLGTVLDRAGKNAADVMLTDTQTGDRFMVSVKNQREILFPGDKAIKDCYAKAKGHGARPWLFIPFAVPAAIQGCKSRGVRLTILNRQIVPAEDAINQQMSWVLRQLQPILGPQPYELLYAKFPSTIQGSESARQDLDRLNRGADSVSDLA